MTENKRFIYAKSEGGVGYAIYDTTKTYTFPNLPREYEVKVFCRVLNELYEENKELRQKNKKILDTINNKITEKGVDWYKAEDNSTEEKESNLQLNVLEEIKEEIIKTMEE